MKSLQVTGPDYLWYAVIALAVVVLVGAVVVFLVQRAKYREAQAGVPTSMVVEDVVPVRV